MKTLVTYVAVDGTRFDNEMDCQKYETLIDKVNAIMSNLKSRPIDWYSGDGYIQQEKETFDKVRKGFFSLCAEYIPTWEKWFTEVANGERHISNAGRVLSDYDIKVLNEAYYRFDCISEDNYREFGQPYYANNQDKVEQKEL